MSEIEPTLSLCDTGWISPKGLYYGLDGEVGHFRHINIANLLYQQGTIDIRTGNIESEPDRWLETNGWLKQSGSALFYAGYFYDVPVTKEQMLAAQKLLCQKYNEIKLQDFSVSVNKLWELDQFQLKKHFTH